jgi:hypothetical protein
MIRFLLALSAVIACGTGPGGEQAAPGGGWVSLFDGETLNGWHIAARPEDRGKDFWRVLDGAISCDSRGRKDHDYVWLV